MDHYMNIYHDIKKHVSINTSTKNSFGQRLASVEGYRLMFGIVPGSSDVLKTRDAAQKTCTELMKEFWNNFNELLRQVPDKDMARPSYRKNLIGKSNQSINILPVDQAFYMSLLDQALATLKMEKDLHAIIYAVKFGMKDPTTIYLSGKFNKITKISLHCAAELSSSAANVHLLWAKEGIRQIVGNRGRIFSCLSINEALNFQSNMDGRALDISAALRRTSTLPQNINFIQLYSDTPHTRGQLLHAHSVTGKLISNVQYILKAIRKMILSC